MHAHANVLVHQLVKSSGSYRHLLCASPLNSFGSRVPERLASAKTALSFLREQSGAWFKHATQLAEQILETDAEAEAPGDEER
mmetsp:Transcript_38434/g.119937  ORF Transcript_38434/g.119937 Transcript_38434/m.119937 type:complete len:83 (-) Transcript_38434:116-364(-)